MTAPVTPLPQAARPGRAQDRPDPAGAAGFASALDGVLSGGREAPDRSTRAADKATAATDRAAARLEKARERAADQTERAAAHLEKATERAADQTERAAARAASSGNGDADPADGTEDDATAPEESNGSETAPGRTGLPAAIWALLTGTAATPAATPTPVPPTAEVVDGSVAGVGPVAVPAAAPPTVDAGIPQSVVSQPAPAGALPTDVATTGDAAVPTAAAPPPQTAAPVPAPAPTGVPSTVAADDAVALAGLSVVVEQPGSVPTAQAVAAAESVAPSGTSPADVAPAAADTEAAVPAPIAGTATPDQATPDDSEGTPAPPAAAAPAADDGAVAVPVPTQVAGTAPVTTTAPAAPVAGTTDAGTAQPVGAQVARQVAVLRGAADGSHTMTLVLTPETLGPVEVQVTVSKGSLDLTLRGAHEHGRAALLDALPDLRRDLEQAGLSVTRAEVDRDTGGSRFSDRSAQYADRQPGFGDRGGQGRGDSRSRPWAGAADTTGGPTPPTHRTTSSGLDVRA